MQKRSRTINGIWTAVLTVLSLAWIYPIVMVVINSFKVESAISTSTAFQFCQRTLNHIARWVAATRVIMRARFIKSGKVIGTGKMDRWDNATILFVVI